MTLDEKERSSVNQVYYGRPENSALRLIRGMTGDPDKARLDECGERRLVPASANCPTFRRRRTPAQHRTA